jgi:hypothetical protein
MTPIRVFFAVLMSAIATAAVAADPTVPDAATPAKERYDAAVGKLRTQHATAVADAAAAYSEKLDALIAKAKDAGNLDAVLALKSEKGRLDKGEPKSSTLPSEATAGRQTYDAAVKKARAEFDSQARGLHTKFLAELTDLEKSETKADRIESAVAVRAFRTQADKAGPPPLVADMTGATVPGPMIGPPATIKAFAWRTGAAKARLLEAGGGNAASEAAVAKGLAWLVKQQQKDGSWKCDGTQPHVIAGTGFGVLAFLGAGDTPTRGAAAHTKAVQNGLTFLTRNQNVGGDFRGSTSMYEHGIATLALCEAYGMTGDAKLKRPAQAAVTHIVRAQHAAGGWRYTPGQAGDTSVVGWQIPALSAAKLAGLDVPAATLKKAIQYLDAVGSSDDSEYGYASRGTGSPSTTMAGLMCRQHLGWGSNREAIATAAAKLDKAGFTEARFDTYFLHYAAPVLYRNGQDWDATWNALIRDLLVKRQDATDGSWKPDVGHVGSVGGRHATTCLALLALEVYYRYPPLEKEKVKP